jgi:MFS family permease
VAQEAPEKYGIRKSLLLNAFWVPLHFQDTALITIAVPAAVVQLAPQDHVRVFAVIAALVSFVSMIVPPIAGAISDRLRRRGVPRRYPILIGAALDVACLIMMAEVHNLGLFMTFLLLATVGANISLAAYQALFPEAVPQAAWGSVSGIRSVAMVVGTVVGLGVAAGTIPDSTFIGIAVAIGLGAFTLFAIAEHPIPDQPEEHAHVSDWHDFTIVFVARGFLAFGLSLLMTFVLYFFRDILKVSNPSGATGLVAFASLFGAIASGIYLGWLSDRVPRKIVVALSGIPMILAAAGFALLPQERWMYAFGVLFGIGFGGIMSTGWALAIDSVPKLRDVARDLGIWGIAQNFPAVIAPLAGGFILNAYHSSISGYRVLFFAAAASFALGSVSVLAVGKRPLIPWWGAIAQIMSAITVGTYIRTAYRVRSWGRLPWRRRPSLVIANHQLEIDLMAPFAAFILSSSLRNPVLSASARSMYEPGFMALRLPWMWRVMRNVNLGWLFEGLGMMPLENELQSRSIARWAWNVQRRHGVLPLKEIFKPAAIEGSGLADLTSQDLFSGRHFQKAQETYVRLSDLQVKYRKEAFDEMRDGVERDLQRIENNLRRGATFFVTPEGEYTRDGAMLRFRGIWDRLAPIAEDVYLTAISYDPFVGRRLSELYRVVKLRDKENVVAELQAARPVTTTALLSEWLATRNAPFTEVEAAAAVEARLASLRKELFVDPELERNPRRLVSKALENLTGHGIIVRRGDRFVLAERRKHPHFPEVDDIIAFQKTFFAQTVRGLEQVTSPAAKPLVSA